MILTPSQLRAFRSRVAAGYRYPPDPAERVTLIGGPLDGLSTLVSARTQPNAIMSHIVHLGNGYVTADYTKDPDGAWRFQQWSRGDGRPVT